MFLIPFENNGNIQPGIHYFTYEMFKKQFVDDIASSRTRREIHHLSFLWLAELQRVVTPVEVWFDGDFTSSIINPKEIELCVFLLRSSLSDTVVSNCLKLAKTSTANYKCKSYYGIMDPNEGSPSNIGPYYWTEQLGFDSAPDYLLAFEMLLQRLSDLTQQKKLLSEGSTSPPTQSNPFYVRLSLSQEGQDWLSLRSLSYFLYGLQHLVDLLAAIETVDSAQQSDELLIQLAESEPFSAQIRINLSQPVQAEILQNLLELLSLTDMRNGIPAYLLAWDSKTFVYVQKWLSFLLEHGVRIQGVLALQTSNGMEVMADPISLKLTLQTLNQIQKNETATEWYGMLNEINVEDKSLELLEPITHNRIRGKSPHSLLMKCRHFLGDHVTISGLTFLTENIVTGDAKSLLMMNNLKE